MSLEKPHFCKRNHSLLSVYRDYQSNEGHSKERQRSNQQLLQEKAFLQIVCLCTCACRHLEITLKKGKVACKNIWKE